MTVASGRPRLKLRPSNLSEIEAAKIGAFLRVGHHRFQCDWSIVLDGSCHVLVRGNPQAGCASASPQNFAAILDVQDPCETPCPDALVRPLQYDAFVEALSALERGLMLRAAQQGAPIPADASAPSLARSPRKPLLISPGAKLRLRRWPPAVVLDAHRYNLRLASFLSGRALRLDELIRWSNVARPQCEEFLLALSNAGLLEVRTADEPSPPLLSTKRTPSRVPVAAERGLLDRIRLRLGLGRP